MSIQQEETPMHKAFATIRFAVPAGIVAAMFLTAGAAFAAPAPSKPAQPSYLTTAAAPHAKPAAKPGAKAARKPAAHKGKATAHSAAKPGAKRPAKLSERNMNDRPSADKAAKDKAARAKARANFKPAGGKVIKKYVGPLKKLPRRQPAKAQ
jgi:hypothetical protein